MHFVAEQNILQECLSVVEKALPGKTPLEIIQGILVEAKNNKLIFMANNLEMGIRAACSVAEIMEEGELVLPRKLVEIIKQFPSGKIEFKTDVEGLRMEILGSGINFFLYGLHADEFPEISPEEQWSQWTKLVFPTNELKSILKKVLFAASQDESKALFKGILVEVDQAQNLLCMASDTYRLAHHFKGLRPDHHRQPLRMLIPGKTLTEIFRILDDSAEEIACYCKENEIIFKYKHYIFSGRLMEDKYPNFSNAFPAAFETRVIVNTESWEKTLGRAALLAQGQNIMISLSIQGDILQVKSGSEVGRMQEDLLLEKKEGHDLDEVIFNGKFLLDPLRVWEDDFIEIKFNGPFGPCVYGCEQLQDDLTDIYRYLVLPIKIDKREY